jgi:hypothetical protein
MLLWSGQVISTVGMRISALAYPLVILVMTRSPLLAGIAGTAQTAPFLLLYLPAGALVDRWDRKRVMRTADGIRVLLLGCLAIVLAARLVTYPQIIVTAFLDGACFVFFQVAESAALPQIVAARHLPTALAQNQAREQGAEMAGAPLAGTLFSVGHALPFAADAATYLISFATLQFVRRPLQGSRGRPSSGLLHEIAEGLSWLRHQHLLGALVAITGATNLAMNALPLAVIVRARQLGADPLLIGLLFVFPGAAAIAGSLGAPWLQRRLPARFLVIGALWLWTATMAALPWLPAPPLDLGVAVGLGSLAGPAFNVVLARYAYALAPDRLRGRVVSSARLVTWGTIPVATLAAGAALQVAGPVVTLLAISSLMLAIAVAATATRTVRCAADPANGG